MGIDISSFTGPLGGIVAIAYGAGAASGYAFCLRTMYKILKAQAEKDENNCKDRVDALERQNDDLRRENVSLQERLIGGLERQQMATSMAGQRLIENRGHNENGA